LNDTKIILNIDKCRFIECEVKLLGYILSKDGIKPDLSKIQKVLGWLIPQNIIDICRFINFTGFYYRYIQRFARLALLLMDLIQGSLAKGTTVAWTDKEDNVFKRIKDVLTTSLCFSNYDL